MLSFQKKNEVEKLVEVLNKSSDFFTVLNKIAHYTERVNHFVEQLDFHSVRSNKLLNELDSNFKDLKDFVSENPLRDYYRSLEELEESLKRYPSLDLANQGTVKNLLINLDEFSRFFEIFSSGQLKSPLKMIMKANEVSLLFDNVRFALEFFLVNSSSEEAHAANENYKKLSIILTSSMNMDTFAGKLISIDKMYKEASDLLNVSTSEYPLIITRIEAGSLWAELYGNKEVITFIAGCITASAAYIYKKYTDEGKWSAIPKKIDAVEELLGLTLKLEEAGINVSKSKENIAKANFILAKQLNILLDGEAEVHINEESYSVDKEVQNKILRSKETFKLEHDE